MTADASIAPLRIANEAFMVAATIERCPRQMMLRELVMNALEASAQATDAPKRVRIDAVIVDNAPKLRIWNTGRGLSQAELLQISDLSSSLFKTVSLDGNFGMGAKAASLASNKHGLRYRSCRLGRVSQIVLGARGGVYGRVLQEDPSSGGRREAINVTAGAIAAGEDLSHDWTEVTLLGNSPQQDTAADPYAGDPLMPRDWVMQTLGRRYMRLPEGVELAIEPSASGAAAREIFAPSLAPSSFDRLEAVEVEGGVVIHYGYRAKDSTQAPPRVNVLGVGAVVHDGEIYALTDDRRWALEAPTYGFTFAAKQCSVIVELPHSFGARPEQYRQFLRFNDGDQHQVQFADFGDLVRANLPVWLKRIIASLLPAESDYLAEIRDEMRHLLAELGIEDLLRAPPKPKPQNPEPPNPESAAEARNPPPATPKPPKPPETPSPPEIIIVEDEADIVEKGLGGRAARYYPAARQVFVNARYAAFARMKAQLAEEFAPFADEEAIQRLAKLTAEWAIIQRIARTLLHSIGKPKNGWSADEIKTAQSPETMSLMVDDIDPLLVPARRRMAAQLGLEPETAGEGAGLGGDPMARRAAGELADAEAQLQRAMAGNVRRLGPHYRQIGAIQMRQRNFEAARAWFEKGVSVDPADPWCRHEYVGLLLAKGELDRAAELAEEALALATDRPSAFRRRVAEVAIRRGELPRARDLLDQAAAEDPQSPWPHYDLAGLHLLRQDFAAAAASADAALQLSAVPSGQLLRRRSEVEMRRGDRAAAAKLLEQARELEPRDPWVRLDLANLAMADHRHADAIEEVEAALALRPASEAVFHRVQSEAELQLGRRAAALAAANRAVRADPSDPWCQMQLAGVLEAVGDLDAAAENAAAAVKIAPTPSPHLYRRQASIESRRRNPAGAASLLQQALDLAPNEPWTLLDLSAQRMALNDLKGADEAAVVAYDKLPPNGKALALRRRAEIALRRKDSEAAGAYLTEAISRAPEDPWCRMDMANLLIARGEAKAASATAQEALQLGPAPKAALLSQAAMIEKRGGDLQTAQGYLQRAIAADADDPQPWTILAELLMASGDLAGAQDAAEKAVEIALGREKTLDALRQEGEAAEVKPDGRTQAQEAVAG